MNTGSVQMAFLLTLLAGLSTGFGSLFILFAKKPNVKLLSISLGLSAGVMIYVSFVEMIPSANLSLINEMGKLWGGLAAVISFLAGIILTALIDKFVPAPENPHEIHTIENTCNAENIKDVSTDSYGRGHGHRHRHGVLFDPMNQKKLLRVGYFTAVVIAIHNIPEGLATFATALKDIRLGMTIAVAIAIHNIPEGITVAVPIYCATGSRRKAFIFSFFSGFTELLGAVIGCTLLLPFLNDMLFGVVFAMVAGIMVFISFDELLPAAREYGEHHLSIYGLIIGMAIMAISMVLM